MYKEEEILERLRVLEVELSKLELRLLICKDLNYEEIKKITDRNDEIRRELKEIQKQNLN